MKSRSLFIALVFFLSVWASADDGAPVKLAALPALSPDGSSLVFVMDRDLWSVPTTGGRATRLTQHPAYDTRPMFSPDGSQLAFASNRGDSWQSYVMPSSGGMARQATFHSEGSTVLDWYPDGKDLLVRGDRDYSGYKQTRFFKVAVDERRAEELLFDAYGGDASLSPDGSRLLFTRWGVDLYRKGYRGSSASQIWLYDFECGEFRRVCDDPSGCRSPLWKPDGDGFYFLTQRGDGCFNLWEHDLDGGKERQLTHFEDASVILPGISRDGGTIVFRQLFDFYRIDPRAPDSLAKLEITVSADDLEPETRRRWYDKAWNNDSYGTVDFSDDALELCFIVGGDLWVMDTVLREPRLVCGETGTHEREAVFGPDGEAIYFLRDDGLGVNIWRARRKDDALYWWQNSEFELEQITDDRLYRFNLGLSPTGERLSVVQDNYELWTYDLNGEDRRRLAKSPQKIYYDWGPKGEWLVASMRDSWGNSDVWMLSESNVRAPYNLSRHPGGDSNARWSPDGRIIAFTGQRFDDQVDIFYVYLKKEDEMKSERERRLQEAIESMESKRKPKDKPEKKPKDEKHLSPDVGGPESPELTASDGRAADGEPKGEQADAVAVSDAGDDGAAEEDTGTEIDFERLSERVHRIRMPGSTPSHLFWSYDSKALAFETSVNGKHGTYKLVFDGSMKPILMNSATGEQARWLEDGSRIVWMRGGVPAIYARKLPFKIYQKTNIPEYKRLAFRIAWRNLRDRFYDPALNRLDWEEIRVKYEDMAAETASWDAFERAIEMLFGELNASHLGLRRDGGEGKEWYEEYSSGQWKTRTAHLGLIFDEDWQGPGLKVAHVVVGGPSYTGADEIEAGDLVVGIEGVDVNPGDDLTAILNGPHKRVVGLSIEKATGELREVEIEPVGYKDARDLIREEWLSDMSDEVERLSDGRLGYLNIEKMNKPSLRRFEHEIFARGFGRDGLVIDVRNNGGGFIADQLLAVLCHPEHAFTIPRGGKRSYQQGYLNTTIWTKPIVVLCNQYSASNAEIFCHAIQSMGRGPVVGVPTRGAVISTPRERLLDIGVMQMPNRGWFLPNGLDMEIQPCVPDHIVEPMPGDIPAGRDPQLAKAVEVLLEELRGQEPPTKPVYASEQRLSE